jgi:hypothetical protein
VTKLNLAESARRPLQWFHEAQTPTLLKYSVRPLVSRRRCSDACDPALCATGWERFQPEKIILFGSYAYGRPHADSDVDLLVIMPAGNELDQAFKIRCEVPPNSPWI